MLLVPQSFYQRDDVVTIAKDLLGKIIQSSVGGKVTSGKIVETEAYRGSDDKGCHSFIHGKTERTKVMFEEGGVAYIYICYGMHHMLNVVTNVEEKADAVLIRAIEPIEGIETMYERRGKKLNNYHLSGGPGKVCQCLGIDKDVNGLPFFSKESPIQLFDSGLLTTEIVSTPRVGMSKNVADYANTPWRFYIKDNPFVSKPLQLSYNYG